MPECRPLNLIDFADAPVRGRRKSFELVLGDLRGLAPATYGRRLPDQFLERHLNSEDPPKRVAPPRLAGLDRLIVDEDSVGASAVRWSIVGPDGQEAVIYQPYP